MRSATEAKRRGAIWCVNWCVKIFPKTAEIKNIGKSWINGTPFVSKVYRISGGCDTQGAFMAFRGSGFRVPSAPPNLPFNFNTLPRTLSTHFNKYGDVCWERDGAQIEARRRVDAGTSARRSNKKMGPSRPNLSGGWGLRAISLSLVVVDVPASPPPLFATSPRKPHPQTLPYL